MATETYTDKVDKEVETQPGVVDVEEGETQPKRKALPGYSVKRGTAGVDYTLEDGVTRSGGSWSSFYLVITAVIGSGVLSLPYSIAMLGWPGGIICLIIFSWLTLYTSQLLADCHIVNGKRQRTYIEVVEAIMGRKHGIIIAWLQQSNLVLTALAYSITSTYAMQNVAISVCEGNGKTGGACDWQFWKAMQVFFSFIPDLDSSIWPCVVGALMSFCYSCISIGRAIAEGNTHGDVKGISGLSTSDKTFGIMNSIGAILFAYSFSMILPEIQDTIKSTVAGGPIKAMRRTVNWSVTVMTFFYMLVAITGYMAYGNDVAGNILNSFVTPRWLVDTANIMVIIHLLPAYQVWSQPFFFFLENGIPKRWPKCHKMFTGWTFRLWFRPLYVALITFLTIAMPFFSYIIGFVGAVGFWPTTVYYPVEMWIKMFEPSPRKRMWLEVINIFCFVCSLIALIGSVQQIVVSWTDFEFFS
ncbi:hypothetical protein N2152v2_002358 [Parachlorella kessleri]